MLSHELLETLFGDKKSITIVQTVGCRACGQAGYAGRIGIFEVLENTAAIQALINRRADRAEVHVQAVKEGMTTLVQDAARKILEQKTTIEEVIRVLQEE